MDYPKRILIVGNGGRECALANACLLSRGVEQLYITPANWGVVDLHGAGRVQALEIKALDKPGITAAATRLKFDLAIIGPEDPLCAGLADDLRAAGIATAGPGQAAARLEGSKLFAKQFMARHGIPTGKFQEFTEPDALLEYCRQAGGPLVLKADGLAAGKGVIVCSTEQEAEAAAQRLMVERTFGDAANTVLAEERLFGREISWTCLVSGGQAELLGASTDYKPLLDGDEGPNTGGMGNICPTPFATEDITVEFRENILAPFARGLKDEGLDYRGFLFVGTMITDQGLKVIEFNVRLGDPEAAVILPMYEADWPGVFAGVAEGRLESMPVAKPGACVAVVIASGNYPYSKSEPAPIDGLERIHRQGLLAGTGEGGEPVPGPVSIYFAGVSKAEMAEAGDGTGYQRYFETGGRGFLASGGRVLNVSARGSSLSDARRLAYEVVGNIRFEGMQFRTDIGFIG